MMTLSPHVEALRAARRAADAMHMLAAALRIAHEAALVGCPPAQLDEIERDTVAPDRRAASSAMVDFVDATSPAEGLDLSSLAPAAWSRIMSRRWCGP